MKCETVEDFLHVAAGVAPARWILPRASTVALVTSLATWDPWLIRLSSTSLGTALAAAASNSPSSAEAWFTAVSSFASRQATKPFARTCGRQGGRWARPPQGVAVEASSLGRQVLRCHER